MPKEMPRAETAAQIAQGDKHLAQALDPTPLMLAKTLLKDTVKNAVTHMHDAVEKKTGGAMAEVEPYRELARF